MHAIEGIYSVATDGQTWAEGKNRKNAYFSKKWTNMWTPLKRFISPHQMALNTRKARIKNNADCTINWTNMAQNWSDRFNCDRWSYMHWRQEYITAQSWNEINGVKNKFKGRNTKYVNYYITNGDVNREFYWKNQLNSRLNMFLHLPNYGSTFSNWWIDLDDCDAVWGGDGFWLCIWC